MGHLMDRPDGLDSAVEWASVLSLGEQQRLAFARLLLSRPQLALMDESTSALDEDNEVPVLIVLHNCKLYVVMFMSLTKLASINSPSMSIGNRFTESFIFYFDGTGTK